MLAMIVKKFLKRLADMAEEESFGGVMRIGVRLGELVMGPVVSAPLVDVILQRFSRCAYVNCS